MKKFLVWAGIILLAWVAAGAVIKAAESVTDRDQERPVWIEPSGR